MHLTPGVVPSKAAADGGLGRAAGRPEHSTLFFGEALGVCLVINYQEGRGQRAASRTSSHSPKGS